MCCQKQTQDVKVLNLQTSLQRAIQGACGPTPGLFYWACFPPQAVADHCKPQSSSWKHLGRPRAPPCPPLPPPQVLAPARKPTGRCLQDTGPTRSDSPLPTIQCHTEYAQQVLLCFLCSPKSPSATDMVPCPATWECSCALQAEHCPFLLPHNPHYRRQQH